MTVSTKPVLHLAIWLLCGLLVLGIGLAWNVRPAEALPEYARRTGEVCATCHVNPGGGGPMTMRGLLWTARGRPDQVPDLPGLLIAPGVEDGAELFAIACSGCHGTQGEGLFGLPLARTGLSRSKIEGSVLRGRLRSGMPSFQDRFTEEQLQALVDYVSGLSGGTIDPPPEEYPLPPARLACLPLSAADDHQTTKEYPLPRARLACPAKGTNGRFATLWGN